MTDRFDDAKRALDDAPAPDLWPEAERRATSGSIVPLDDAVGRSEPRPLRWLAAAAVVAVIAGAVGLAVREEDPEVRTDPAGEGAMVPLVPPTSDFPAFDGRCGFALDGDGPHRVIADATSPWFPADSQPAEQQVVQLQLGDTQTAEIAVPGVVLTDLVGERVEDVELARGTGAVWFSPEFVQARWFTGSQEPCESFTVTVWGGTEDGNRHAAIDLAEQVRLPSDLRAAIDRSIEGDWVLAGATLDGEDLAVEPIDFGFHEGTASWSDGCNEQRAAYEPSGATSIRLSRHEDRSPVACVPDARGEAVDAVMGAEVVALSTTRDALVLRDDSIVDGATLTLRPAEGRITPPTEPPADAATEPYGIWPMTAPEAVLGYLPEVTGTPDEVALAFAARELGWTDAVIDDREPSEDGSSGTVFLVRSAAVGGAVEVGVRPGAAADADDPSRSNVVYRVEVPGRLADPEAVARVLREGAVGQLDVGPPPAGAASDIAYWVYGEYRYVGGTREPADLFDTAGWDGRPLPGAVLLLFRDAELNVVSAWGVALPPGDVDLDL